MSAQANKKKWDDTVCSIFIYQSLILLEIIRKEMEMELRGLNFSLQWSLSLFQELIIPKGSFTWLLLLSALFTFILLLSVE